MMEELIKLNNNDNYGIPLIQNDEIGELTLDTPEQVNEDALELEELIIQGTKATIPIIINYPVYNGETIEYKPVSAFIKPITSPQYNNAYRKGLSNKNTSPQIEITKIGLYNKNMEHFKPELVEQMAGGVVGLIATQIMDVSGIKINNDEAVELVKKVMDF